MKCMTMRESEVKNTIANAFAKVEIHKTNLSLTQVALRGKKKKAPVDRFTVTICLFRNR